VKRYWDEDTRESRALKVVLLGSAPLLVQQGLTESLAGRFEVLHLPHWSFAEMHAAFGFSLDQYLYFGGYPGAAPLVAEPDRWRRYVLDSLVETTIARDVLLMTRVDKPALLRRLFELGCRYSGQVLSYTKMLGQLQDAGNTTTLAHYLELLAGAGLLQGITKFSGIVVRARGSSPKLQVLNTALMSAQTTLSFDQFRTDRDYTGRLVESAVGAHLAAAGPSIGYELFYWRERQHEVDFVVRSGKRLTAIEVKSSRAREARSGLAAFEAEHGPCRRLLVGADGIAIEEFLSRPAEQWIAR
jgi:predicted AAA+ superfamily ATPase